MKNTQNDIRAEDLDDEDIPEHSPRDEVKELCYAHGIDAHTDPAKYYAITSTVARHCYSKNVFHPSQLIEFDSHVINSLLSSDAVAAYKIGIAPESFYAYGPIAINLLTSQTARDLVGKGLLDIDQYHTCTTTQIAEDLYSRTVEEDPHNLPTLAELIAAVDPQRVQHLMLPLYNNIHSNSVAYNTIAVLKQALSGTAPHNDPPAAVQGIDKIRILAQTVAERAGGVFQELQHTNIQEVIGNKVIMALLGELDSPEELYQI